jgi:AraC-like DNA-binding protein
MPSSTIRTFTDPDDFAASFVGTNVALTMLGHGRFEAKLTFIDLGRLKMRQLSDNLPRIGHTADVAEQAIITFRTHPGPSLIRDGAEMLTQNIIRRRSSESSFQKSDGHARWGFMSVPMEDLASIGAATGGCDLTPPKDARSVTPQPSSMAKLLRLHAAAAQLAEDAPAVMAHPEAARGLEQALIEAMVDCFGTGELGEDRSALRRHAAIIRRFRRVVEENPDQALFVPELCKAIGASERTLRVCCQEHVGISPKQYLLLRRMHLVRRGLRERASTATTVTEIATQYAFWNLGRFAGEYKVLFDEFPSATLARPPEQGSGHCQDNLAIAADRL